MTYNPRTQTFEKIDTISPWERYVLHFADGYNAEQARIERPVRYVSDPSVK